jgi:hypothetical protein
MKKISITLFILSVGCVLLGFVVAFHYGDYDEKYNTLGSQFGHVVGGDAYNYIIIGIRGLCLIAVGMYIAIVACGISIYDLLLSKSTIRDDTSTKLPLDDGQKQQTL